MHTTLSSSQNSSACPLGIHPPPSIPPPPPALIPVPILALPIYAYTSSSPFLLKLGRMKDWKHLCHPSNKTGSWQSWLINDYSALLSQYLEDLCPRMDEPVIYRDRLINNLEMDGDPEVISSGFHPGQEVPGSTLEGRPFIPSLPLSNVPPVHINGSQFTCVSVVRTSVSKPKFQHRSTEK